MTFGSRNHSLQFRPLVGGTAIINPMAQRFGTLGFVATSNGSDRWIVSCFHVLCRLKGQMPERTAESIYYAMDIDQLSPIASISDARVDRESDCAAAIVEDRNAIGRILGIGRLRWPRDPKVGARVLKAGAATGITEGHVSRVTPTEVEIAPIGLASGYRLSEPGDSGALWVDALDNAPVAMHLRGNEQGTSERAFARPLKVVLQSLRLDLLTEE